MDASLLAKAVLHAEEVYEQSWDEQTSRYKISHRDASQSGCESVGLTEVWFDVVHTMVFLTWNNSQAWARAVLK